MNRTRIALSAVLAVAALAAGSAFAARGGATTVELRSTSLGKVLADSHGMTLYLYTPDRRGTSVCYGQCASYWPPLLTTAKPHAAAGVKASLLGTTKRKDGKLQVTYAGHPLYLFVQDTHAGQTKGEGFQSIWYVVSAAGAKVAAAKAAAPPTTTTSPGINYGGGGY